MENRDYYGVQGGRGSFRDIVVCRHYSKNRAPAEEQTHNHNQRRSYRKERPQIRSTIAKNDNFECTVPEAGTAIRSSSGCTWLKFHLLESNLGSSIAKQRNVVIICKSEREVNLSSDRNLGMNNHVLQHRAPRVFSRALQCRGTTADNRNISIGLDSVGRQEHDRVSKASAGEERVVNGHDVAVLLVGEVSSLGVEEEARGDG